MTAPRRVNERYNIYPANKYLWIFVGTVLFGAFAHGFRLTNLILFHDEARNFENYYLEWSFSFGRWGAAFFQWFQATIYGGDNISAQFFHGLVGLGLIGINSCLMIYLYEIRSTLRGLFIGAMMAVFPTVTSLFGYMFMGVSFLFAYVLTTFSVILFLSGEWKRMLIAVVLMATAIGIYQAVIPFALGLLLLRFVQDLIKEEAGWEWKSFFAKAMARVLFCVCFMGIYLIVSRITRTLSGQELTTYQGIGSAFNVSVREMGKRIIRSYYRLLIPYSEATDNMAPQSIRYFYYLVLIAISILVIISVKRCFGKSRRKGIQVLLCIALAPLAINFIYVMVGLEDAYIYALMLYSQALIYVMLFILIELNENVVQTTFKYLIGGGGNHYCCSLLSIRKHMLYQSPSVAISSNQLFHDITSTNRRNAGISAGDGNCFFKSTSHFNRKHLRQQKTKQNIYLSIQFPVHCQC